MNLRCESQNGNLKLNLLIITKMLSTPQTVVTEYARMLFFVNGAAMNLPVKIRRDWHYYAFAIGLIFILNGVVGVLGFEAKGWQTYAVGLVTWVISFWLAGLIIRRRDEETENAQ
ncbi:DUF2754 domain-containing protein [Shigella flexneri]|uniref:DUF2754 domain-containing protein n=7 Tax=Shigella flexneri TaxID=623 RepID=A0A7L4U0M5_SHIFL|nr:conserved hypothetical protein [Shigella flexneri 2a str. 301]AAP15783.1 hypothetical protein S0255 [Shigella flexneri 2a str. 2457T]ADA72579.1 hypothetical protein SFxv_0246 [Shigella flexneri 2002017]ASQ51967.1 hypothetical protein BS654_01835 [Shigella flexneri 4c]ASQ60637.1 hypothetical protein BS647_00605 [Shigella flexneri 1a]OLN05909.1 hypothetical protein [Shigella flexneri]OUZ56720.1 hypothetical protein CBL27_21325 [Shigella sonnei]